MPDAEAVTIWNNLFPNNTSVPLLDFINAYEDYMLRYFDSSKLPPIPCSLLLSCVIFTQDQLVTKDSFQHFLKLFGPCAVSLAKIYTSLFSNSDGMLHSWYHGSITRDRSQELLTPLQHGKYLVRLSETRPGLFTLVYVNSALQLKHTLIYNYGSRGYGLTPEYSEGKAFPALPDFLSRHSAQFCIPVRSKLFDIYCSVYAPLQGSMHATYENYFYAGVVNHHPMDMSIDAGGYADNYSVFSGNGYNAYDGEDDDLPDAAPQLRNIRSCSNYRLSSQQAAAPTYITPSAMFANGKAQHSGDTYGCFEARPSQDFEELPAVTSLPLMQRRISEMLDQCSHRMTSGDDSAALRIASSIETQLAEHIQQLTPRSPITTDRRSGIPSLKIVLSRPVSGSPQDHAVLRAFEMMAQANMHRGTLAKKFDVAEAKKFLQKAADLCVEVLEHFLCHDLLPVQGGSPRVTSTASSSTNNYDICEIAKLLFSAYKQLLDIALLESDIGASVALMEQMSCWALLLCQEEWRTYIKSQALQLCVNDSWQACLNIDAAHRSLSAGLASFQVRNFEASERDISRALRIARIIGDPVLELRCTFNMAILYCTNDNWVAALSYLRQSASLCSTSEKQLRRKVLYHYLKCLVQLKHYTTASTLIPVLLSITAERPNIEAIVKISDEIQANIGGKTPRR